MNWIISLIVKFSGLGKLWDMVDGYKTKIGTGGLMLAGVGMMFAGAAQVVAEYAACGDHACQVALFKGIAHSDGAKLLLQGFLAFKGGLSMLGVGHKLDKATAAPDAAPAQP